MAVRSASGRRMIVDNILIASDVFLRCTLTPNQSEAIGYQCIGGLQRCLSRLLVGRVAICIRICYRINSPIELSENRLFLLIYNGTCVDIFCVGGNSLIRVPKLPSGQFPSPGANYQFQSGWLFGGTESTSANNGTWRGFPLLWGITFAFAAFNLYTTSP